MPMDKPFLSLDEAERIRGDVDLVNKNVKELYDITVPLYENLPDGSKKDFMRFLLRLYRDVARTYHKIAMGDIQYISENSYKEIKDYANERLGECFSGPNDDGLLKLMAAVDTMWSATPITQVLSMKVLDIYEILTGIEVRKTLDEITESCPQIKDYLSGFEKNDAFYTILYSIFLNSARVYSVSIFREAYFDKSVVKQLANNTLASILPVNEKYPELEKLVADDKLLDAVYKNIDVVFEKLVAKIDSRFSEKEQGIIKSMKRIEREPLDYIL